MASKIDIVIEAVDNLSGTVKKIEGNIEKMSRQADKSMKRVQRSSKEMSDKTVSSMKKMTSAFSNFTITARRIGALVGSFYAVRSALTALAGVADDFKDFNEAMAYVNTIAQLSTEQLAKLTLQVEDLSIQMGKSAPELARGLYDIYSSGFEGAEAMKVLEVATTGAIAGLTTTAVAARGLMAVMNAYNRKTGADAVDIMDSMFKTVDKGVVTFTELATEIGSVVTVSSQLGIPFTDISAAMSEMTLRGLSAAESATALEGLMRSILKPADQTKEAAKKLGIEWNVAALRAKGLDGMMMELSKAVKGNYEVVGEMVPSIRGLRSAMVLTAEEGEGFNKMLKEQADRLGATQRAFEEANKSINRQLEETRAEWDKYKRDVGETLAKIELKLFQNLVVFTKWMDTNKVAIMATVETIKQLTVAFLTFQAVSLSITGITAAIRAFGKLKYAMQIAVLAMQDGILVAGNLKLVLTALTHPFLITIAIAGVAYILNELNKIKGVYDDIANRDVEMRKQIRAQQLDFAAKALSDQQTLEIVKANAQKNADAKTLKQAEELQKNIDKLEKVREEKRKSMAILGVGSGTFIVEMNKEISELSNAIKEGKEKLEKEGKLIGGLLVSPSGEPAKITEPEYAGFPPRAELLGPEVDKAAEKTMKTIKKINKEISEYYADLGDFANEQIETMEDQADAFADLALDFNRYLEDMDIDLDRMEARHKQVISGIRDDIADENRDFAESMDDRARKFQDTMASMTTRHTDKTDDLIHQIELEKGMGIRADKEKLRELYKRLERENRDYADKVAKDKEEKDREDERDRNRNSEAISDFEERLGREITAYGQKADDIKRMLDREKFDYFAQQDDIREKTNDTLQGIVDDYQKAFSNIFNAIRESGVPSLLAKLPELMDIATTKAIEGIQIPRNYAAEEEFVKNWQGLFGRKATPEDVNLGVYGTTDVPWANGGGVTVNVYNPVVVDDAYTNKMAEQINIKIGEAQRLNQNGAY